MSQLMGSNFYELNQAEVDSENFENISVQVAI